MNVFGTGAAVELRRYGGEPIVVQTCQLVIPARVLEKPEVTPLGPIKVQHRLNQISRYASSLTNCFLPTCHGLILSNICGQER